MGKEAAKEAQSLPTKIATINKKLENVESYSKNKIFETKIKYFKIFPHCLSNLFIIL